MKLVIDIPEEEYERMIEQSMFGRVDVWKRAIKKGVPLPKGHGRLIDADELKKHKYHDNDRFENAVAVAQIDWADTIIDADKAESEKDSSTDSSTTDSDSSTGSTTVKPEKKHEPCEDVISRREAIKKFTYDYKGERIPEYDCDNFPTQISFKDVKKWIRELPSVEPERKPGKWIDISRDGDMGEFYCCSLCKREIILYPGETLKDYPYCHCGARMEVENDD